MVAVAAAAAAAFLGTVMRFHAHVFPIRGESATRAEQPAIFCEQQLKPEHGDRHSRQLPRLGRHSGIGKQDRHDEHWWQQQ
jgi:hypothetical protein